METETGGKNIKKRSTHHIQKCSCQLPSRHKGSLSLHEEVDVKPEQVARPNTWKENNNSDFKNLDKLYYCKMVRCLQ